MHGGLSMETQLQNVRLQELVTQCAHCIDDDRLEDWPSYFTDDAQYRIVTRENHERKLPLSLVYCNGTGMLADRISALRTANIYEPHTYCHILGPLQLLNSDGGKYQTRTNFTILRTMSEGDLSIFTCGKFLDTIVEHDGALKFKQRLIILDSRRIDTLLVIPI